MNTFESESDATDFGLNEIASLPGTTPILLDNPKAGASHPFVMFDEDLIVSGGGIPVGQS